MEQLPPRPTTTPSFANQEQQGRRTLHQPTNRTFTPTTILGLSPGKALVDWYRGLFSALSTLGTLGAGFTLSVVVIDSSKPTRAGFKPSTVATWAAISSVLFIQTVIVSQGASQLFKFEQAAIVEGIDEDDPGIRWWLSGLSLLLQGHIIGAFLFLELVLAAHVPRVGWIGVATTTLLGLVALSLWFAQVSGRKPIAQYRRYVVNKRVKVDHEAERGKYESTE